MAASRSKDLWFPSLAIKRSPGCSVVGRSGPQVVLRVRLLGEMPAGGFLRGVLLQADRRSNGVHRECGPSCRGRAPSQDRSESWRRGTPATHGRVRGFAASKWATGHGAGTRARNRPRVGREPHALDGQRGAPRPLLALARPLVLVECRSSVTEAPKRVSGQATILSDRTYGGDDRRYAGPTPCRVLRSSVGTGSTFCA